ncbi:hypothetical protein SOVF_072560 [Spinacia oleracea]|uniref:Transmembrane protein n=1 Tax=Spinacia oleracea TaxID=3562 RepID=A0A9R0IEX2_SPIOL|nr:uncharacterized protein LOC110786602 [Spinacia oleracea]KNA18258.1 hypothetical protein SOVF_072560 [Spinacia oleracea]
MERLFSITIITLLILLVIVVGESRELRPSEHGLPFQNLPEKSPDMVVFFGDQDSPPEKKPPAIVGSMNETASSDTWWRESPGKRKEIKLSKALMIATVVCGCIGVVLLLAAAFLFALNFYRRISEASSASAVASDNVNHSASVSAVTVDNATVPNKQEI